MDAFIEAFYAIDVDRSETITLDELRNYMDKNNMDPAFIERWQEIFDPENTGSISLHTFCDVLGLELNNIREKYDAVEFNKPDPMIEHTADDEFLHPESKQNASIDQNTGFSGEEKIGASTVKQVHSSPFENEQEEPKSFENGETTEQVKSKATGKLGIGDFGPPSSEEHTEDRNQKETFENGNILGNNYEEISVDIAEDLKNAIVRYAKEGLKCHEEDRELVKWLKQRMDKEHGRLWHCTIVRGQYFSFYSYTPGHSFCFKLGPRIFIIFKTPCY